MGVVWVAHDLRLESPCAVKFLVATIDDGARKRFALEAKAAAQLRSPNVVQVLDHGEADGMPYIAMELLDGEDLASRLARQDRLDSRKTAEVVDQIARALGRAHAAGLIHRDLKPANVFLVRDDDREIVKVLDFGIAKAFAEEAPISRSGAPHAQTDISLTATGIAMGTPGYMSPEQVEGHDVDSRSDVWSLGVVAYQCLTGRLPFESENLGRLYSLILSGEPPAITTLVPELPAATDGWVAKALAKKREERFGSARELAEALDRALAIERGHRLDGSTGPTRVADVEMGFAPTQAVERPLTTTQATTVPRRSVLVPAVAVTAVIAVASAGYFGLRSLVPTSPPPAAGSIASVSSAPLPAGSAPLEGRSLEPFVAGSARVVEVAVGAQHSCARLDSGAVTCWGRGTEGQLGAPILGSAPPVMVTGVEDAIRVHAAGSSTCILRKTGNPVCHGQAARDLEATAALGEGVLSLAVSPREGLCAVKAQGRIVCSPSVRGRRDSDGTITGIDDAVQVEVGQEHACALRRSGKVSCWGSNRAFQLGGRPSIASETPEDVPGAERIVELSASRAFTCARSREGVVLCWGDPTFGALGAKDLRKVKNQSGEITLVEPPAFVRAEPVLGVTNAVDIAVGGFSACAVTATGEARCWGSNAAGMLGGGTFGAIPFDVGATPPPPVTPLSNAVQVSLGDEHACALLSSGAVHCWGRNDDRQLGTDTVESCELGRACSTRPVRAL
ncbi:MAG: protein kinase [Myxococcales bacterium]|nr:protein kinase [Myxococcales bacterium]